MEMIKFTKGHSYYFIIACIIEVVVFKYYSSFMNSTLYPFDFVVRQMKTCTQVD